MKIAVIGAGIIGVSSAYELTLDGHEVTVFERRHSAAEEASFANGSLIAPGWSAAVAAAGRNLRSLLSGPPGQRAALLARWPRSHERLQSLRAELQLDYDRSDGLLVLWRSQQELDGAHAAVDLLRDLGWSGKMLSGAQARLLEPALNAETPLHGALAWPAEAVANCRQFALLLKTEAQRKGCRFEFGTRVTRMALDPGVTLSHVSSTQGSPQSSRFDAVVLCAAAASTELLRPLGLQLPLLPLYGHSISAALREPLDAPLSAVLDTQHQVSITRLGQRVRVSGGLRLRGTPGSKSDVELRHLYRVLADWFPGAARLGGSQGSVQEWHGAQATLPDGPPLVGASKQAGLWLNLGHGDSGWSLACGSARTLADLMHKRRPDVDPSAYSPQRFGL